MDYIGLKLNFQMQLNTKKITKQFSLFHYFAYCAVASTRIEPMTQGYSILCSTIPAM